MELPAFIAKWSASGGSERAKKDSFLNHLCDALDVRRPDPNTGVAERDRYVFEKDAWMSHAGGKVSCGKLDQGRVALTQCAQALAKALG